MLAEIQVEIWMGQVDLLENELVIGGH